MTVRTATAPASCNVLRETAGADLVIVNDFAAAGRPTATFTELVAALTGPYTYWETAPPPYGRERDMGGTDHADRWAADLRASGRPVRALLGFCTGNLYSGALAERIAGWQDEPPRLILIDPEVSSRRPILDHYERMIGRLSRVLTPEQSAHALAEGRAAFDRPGPPLALAAEISDLCRRIVQPGFERSGFSPARAQEYVALFNAYLYWFAAADELDTVGTWAAGTAINGETPGFGLDTFADPQRTELVAHAVHVPVAHNELLRSPVVAALVDELLS